MATEASDVQEVPLETESEVENIPDDEKKAVTSNNEETAVPNESVENKNTQVECGICESSYDSSVDHIEDLCNEVVMQGGDVVKKLTAHWPHFISSQIMQIYCSVCSVHLKTFRDLLIHCHLMKTEDGFKKSNKPVSEWSEEIGQNHADNYSSIVTLIKEISGGIDKCQVGLLQPYLCKTSPRYYEIAYLSGSYDDTKSPIAESKRKPNTDLIFSDKLAKIKCENEESYALVEGDKIDRIKEIEEFFFPKKEQEAATANGKPVLQKPANNILKCLKCNDLFPNLRRHVVTSMWQLKKPCIDRVRHWIFFFGTDGSKIDNFCDNSSTLMCPVCHMHIFRKGIWGFIALFDHLLDNGIPRKHLPNEFSKEHRQLLVFLTDITMDMVSGDIDSTEAFNLIVSKFTCAEGGTYMLPKQKENNSNNSKQSQKRPADQRNQKNQLAAKKARNEKPTKRGGKKVREFYARISDQKSQRSPATVNKPQNIRSPVSGVGLHNKRGGQIIACDLCDFKGNSFDHLRNHLRQSLFAGNQMVMEAHLTCFSKMMVFNNNCVCPACGCYQMNLLNCVQHLAMMANNGEMTHVGTVNLILDQYMKCMTRVVSLQSVTSWLHNFASMRW